MGLLQYFDAKDWYSKLDSGKDFVAGQFVWCPALQLDPHPLILEASRVISNSHAEARCKIVPMTDSHFKERERETLPIAPLKLGEREEAMMLKAKKRPGIVISSSDRPKVQGAPHHQVESRLVVAPVYGIANEEHLNGFRDPLWTRIRHLQHRHFFPLAAWHETRARTNVPGACSLSEGVIRLDRLQFVTPAGPSCHGIPVRLGDEPWALLRESLGVYLGFAASTSLSEMANLLSEELPAAAR